MISEKSTNQLSDLINLCRPWRVWLQASITAGITAVLTSTWGIIKPNFMRTQDSTQPVRFLKLVSSSGLELHLEFRQLPAFSSQW